METYKFNARENNLITERKIYEVVHNILNGDTATPADSTPTWATNVSSAFDRKWDRSFMVGISFCVSATELRDPMISALVRQKLLELDESQRPVKKIAVVSNCNYMNQTIVISSISTAEARKLLEQYINQVKMGGGTSR